MTKTKMLILDVILGVILAVLIVGNCLAVSYFELISIHFDQPTWVAEKIAGDTTDTAYYKSEFETARALRAAQIEFAKDLQAEATVLLQNSNDTLPLKANAKVTLLGAGSAMDQFMVGGIGSGAIDSSSLTPLKTVFENAGYSVNSTMVDFYAVGAGSTYRRVSAQGKINEVPVEIFASTQTDSFASYKDAGIIIIGRESGEGAEIPFETADDPDKNLMQLSSTELELVDYSIAQFDKTIVLINTTMPMELDELVGKDIACLYIGGGGMNGYEAIPEILNGNRFPSGRLTDTYSANSFNSASSPNYDSFALIKPTTIDSTFTNSTYALYEEGIYVGYRYYETRYEDVVMRNGNAGSFDYVTEVVYPFGYGLNYADFVQSEFNGREDGSDFVFSVKVTNNGTYTGKEVVQIYMQSPYTAYDKENCIEKSSVVLAGFEKTKALAAGESEVVTVRVPKSYMRSYDAKAAKTYIVDAGTYYFTAGKNAHDAINNILAKKGKTVADGMTSEGNDEFVWSYEVATLDAETYSYGEDGNKITNQFDKFDLASYFPDDVTYLTRSNWTDSFPSFGPDHPELTATSAMLADYAVKHEVDQEATIPTTSADSTLTLASMINVPYEHESWDTLLNKLTPSDMMNLVENGGYYTVKLLSIDKPRTIDKDGPSGITSTLIGGTGCFGFPIEMLVACSWNKEMARRLGELVGEDGILAKVAGWYAPGLNTHRNPFNGRNYEYYSEDPVLGTKIGTAVTIGCQSRGTYVYIKHFALDDQGTGGGYTFCNEQAVREIYLRQFEETVIVGDARACMTNNGNVGMTWCGRSKNLMTNVLRNEWGFKGFVITDQCTANRSERLDIIDGMAAGTDLWLNAAAGTWIIDGYASNPTVMNLLRKSCKNILYTVANSNAMNGISPSTKIVPVIPAWMAWLITADVVLGVLIVGGAVLAFVFYMKRLNKSN